MRSGFRNPKLANGEQQKVETDEHYFVFRTNCCFGCGMQNTEHTTKSPDNGQNVSQAPPAVIPPRYFYHQGQPHFCFPKIQARPKLRDLMRPQAQQISRSTNVMAEQKHKATTKKFLHNYDRQHDQTLAVISITFLHHTPAPLSAGSTSLSSLGVRTTHHQSWLLLAQPFHITSPRLPDGTTPHFIFGLRAHAPRRIRSLVPKKPPPYTPRSP